MNDSSWDYDIGWTLCGPTLHCSCMHTLVYVLSPCKLHVPWWWKEITQYILLSEVHCLPVQLSLLTPNNEWYCFKFTNFNLQFRQLKHVIYEFQIRCICQLLWYKHNKWSGKLWVEFNFSLEFMSGCVILHWYQT